MDEGLGVMWFSRGLPSIGWWLGGTNAGSSVDMVGSRSIRWLVTVIEACARGRIGHGCVDAWHSTGASDDWWTSQARRHRRRADSRVLSAGSPSITSLVLGDPAHSRRMLSLFVHLGNVVAANGDAEIPRRKRELGFGLATCLSGMAGGCHQRRGTND